MARKSQIVDHVSESEDEEIPEDEAFNSEDERKYGSFFEGKNRSNEAESSERESDRDDDDDDDSGKEGRHANAAGHSEEPESEEEKSGDNAEASVSEDDQDGSEDDRDGSEDDQDGNEDDQDGGEDEDEDDRERLRLANTVQSTSSTELCTFDLRNLVAVNSHQPNATELYSSKGTEAGNVTIPLKDNHIRVSERQLHEKAQDGCAQLISALWQLPTERGDVGPMVTLPSYFEIKTPRALPAPPPKQETKWEKFAKERGIGLNKEKRSRKVWDEATGSWMYRHGYEKANNDATEWPIMEVKRNEDPYEDPWERLRDAKRARVEKNMENRMRNQEKVGHVPKGTATRVMKNLTASRKAGKAGGNRDRDNVLPTGIPVDLKATKSSEILDPKKRGKESTVAALIASQRSTASLGNFDQMRTDEPERRKAMSGLKKRKFESGTDKKVVTTEAERGMKLLQTVMSGGGAAREKARRKGALAKGETAYDYDFDDGLGASSFRKKKGRAGVGKMKKMTKKRAK